MRTHTRRINPIHMNRYDRFIAIVMKAMDKVHSTMTTDTLTCLARHAIEQISLLSGSIILKMTFRQDPAQDTIGTPREMRMHRTALRWIPA